ncbi:MAG TPA: peptidase M23, partial [Chryseosolibacter sp.]|nr:peptidase M23 [Chryseosolibacter sp.]
MVKKFFGFVAAIVLAGGALFLSKRYSPSLSQVPVASATVPDSTEMTVIEKEPKMLYGMVIPDDHIVIEDKFKRNQFLGDIL